MGSTKPFRKGAKPKEETSFLPGGKQSSAIYYLNSAVETRKKSFQIILPSDAIIALRGTHGSRGIAETAYLF